MGTESQKWAELDLILTKWFPEWRLARIGRVEGLRSVAVDALLYPDKYTSEEVKTIKQTLMQLKATGMLRPVVEAVLGGDLT